MTRRWLLGSLLGGGVAWMAHWRRTLTLDGAIAAAGVGAVVFARGGLPAAGALLVFFGSSSALSRLGERRKQSLPLAQAKGARRDVWQVFANGGIATLSIATGQPAACVGALAAACADTWATELGLLAKGQPRLITTLRPVEAGTSGGVTLQGLAASLGGAVLVGAAWGMFGGGWRGLRTAAIAGTAGSVADSLLGATVQDDRTWINNDAVNAIATLVGAVVGRSIA